MCICEKCGTKFAGDENDYWKCVCGFNNLPVDENKAPEWKKKLFENIGDFL